MAGLDINALSATAITITKGVAPTLVETITYKYQATPPEYDVERGTVLEDAEPLSFDVVRTKLTNDEKLHLNGDPDLELKSTDRVYLVPHNNIGRSPALSDVIVIGTDEDDEQNQHFRVVGWYAVPGDSLYKVVCRRG